MYTTVEDVKNYTQKEYTALEEATIEAAIGMWSEVIERITERVFSIAGETTRKYDGDRTHVLFIDEAISITSVSFDDEEVDEEDYEIYPLNLPHKNRIVFKNAIIPRGRGNVSVTGKFGFSEAVPDVIKMITTILVSAYISTIVRDKDRTSEIKSLTLDKYKVEYDSSFKEGLKDDVKTAQELLKMYKKYHVL